MVATDTAKFYLKQLLLEGSEEESVDHRLTCKELTIHAENGDTKQDSDNQSIKAYLPPPPRIISNN